MRQSVALFFAAAVLGCADHGPDKDTVLGPDDAPAYKLAALPPDNALLRLSDLTGRNLRGRIKVDAYVRESRLVNGTPTMVETRVATVTAQADATFALYVPGIPGDSDGNGVVDFDDFFLFTDVFGLFEGADGFNAVFDFDGNGSIDFTDFFIFADNFGRRSPRGAGKTAAIASPVSYEDAPRGRMSEEAFRAAWEALHELLNAPQPARKQLQASEPEYRFHIQSLETPPAFEPFDIIITGSFPAPGEEPRELWVTPEGARPPPVVTQSLAISPADTTVDRDSVDTVPGRTIGEVVTLYDGEPAFAEGAELELVSTLRKVEEYEDGSWLTIFTYTFGDLEAAQRVIAAALPNASVNARLTRYLSAIAGGRVMNFRVDVNAVESISRTVRMVVYRDGVAHAALDVDLEESAGSPNHRWAFPQFSVPENTATRTVSWRIVFTGETLRGGSGTSSVEFTQAAAESPPPAPEPEPAPTPPSPKPTLAAGPTGPASLSANQPGTFTATASNATRIDWYVTFKGVRSGVLGTGSSFSFSSSSAGNHIVEAVAVNDSGSDVKTDSRTAVVFVRGGAAP